MYIVLHSQDPYLLARASMELQMAGVRYEDWSGWITALELHPFYPNRKWLSINHPECGKNSFTFWGIKLTQYNPTRYTLTSRSYNKIMETIINSICKTKS